MSDRWNGIPIDKVPLRPRERVTTADTPEEFAAIAHLRGWCHDGDICPICAAKRQGALEAINRIACG